MTARQALVLAGHGSHLDARSAEPTLAHADRIRASGRFDEVRAAFWKEEPPLAEVLRTLESDRASVVPIMTSEGYFVEEVFPRELRPEDPAAPSTVRYAEPVGTHASVADVIVRRAASARGNPAVGPGTALAIVGHGTERHATSGASTRRHAARIRATDRFDEVRVAFLDEPPAVEGLIERVDAPEVVVVPLFVANGHHVTEDIPAALGIGDRSTDETGSYRTGGRRIWYAGAVGTDPRLADVVVERAIEAGATPATDRRGDAPLGEAGRAFAGWVQAAGDGSRRWGDLAVTATGTTLAGPFDLRHRHDEGATRTSLASLEDPEAVRDRCRRDDAGRYRPLRGARTLPTGWVAGGLDARELVRAVDHVYPVSIANWYRERTGDLDAVDWPETAARQTGRYGSVGSVDGDDLAWTIEAVCGDCVRCPAWAESDGPPAAEGDRGEIPCREACSFFVAAVHAFGDADHDLSTANAPPETVPAGTFDRPGNRYRDRYLAARDRDRAIPSNRA